METNKSSPKTTLYPRLPHHIHYLPNLQFRFTLTSCFMFVFQSWFYSHNCSRSFYSPLERGRIHFFLNIQSNNTRHSWFSSMRQRRVWSNLECQHHCCNEANGCSLETNGNLFKYIWFSCRKKQKNFRFHVQFTLQTAQMTRWRWIWIRWWWQRSMTMTMINEAMATLTKGGRAMSALAVVTMTMMRH